MILSPKNKFAFFRIPKTGSSTAAFFLNISRTPLEDDYSSPMPAFGIGEPIKLNRNDPMLEEIIHASPKIALKHKLITMDQLRSYDSYGFVRDPYRRLLSGLLHALGPRQFPQILEDNLKTKGYKGIVDAFGILVGKQVDYFFIDGEQVLTPLSMKNYEDNLRMMIAKVSDIYFPVIPHLNSRQIAVTNIPFEEWMTPTFKNIVEDNYQDDIEFYNKVMNNAT